MKLRVSFCSLFILLALSSFSQTFRGQWKGMFDDRSVSSLGFGGSECEYVLDLETSGTKVSGYSYTYFTDGGKKYYTICKLEGFFDKRKKYIEVKETERTKTNVPENIRNCFQIHRLSYSKAEGVETLKGSWIPVPDQLGSCGYGVTTLTRRNLKSVFPNFKNKIAKAPAIKHKPAPSPIAKAVPLQIKPATPKTATAPVTKKNTAPVAKNNNYLKPSIEGISKQETAEKPITDKTIAPFLPFEKRNNTLLKTIEVENETIKVDLYDNGEVDGDSISLFYNGKLLLSHKRLSEKAITLNVPVPEGTGINELVMYAENLGSIPPNTALMVVTDGKKRYEVRITSDLQKSGTIRFVHKSP
ncbi:MAG: hypothetical protein JSU03_09550 [Bacteroidetes bacterium]|nr:hypothetical protein [Bacteroidota bacterium]MBS1757510.1 hypothetical protein [Bacteroidota bacterium]